jgi:hypothetical protein
MTNVLHQADWHQGLHDCHSPFADPDGATTIIRTDSADRNHEKVQSEENGWRARMGCGNQAIGRRCKTGVSRNVDGAALESLGQAMHPCGELKPVLEVPKQSGH